MLLLGKVIHWYNPFIYLLGRELEENLEYCCDFQVIERLNSGEKKEYALSVLSTYEKGGKYGLGLSYRTKGLERRVKKMFEKKKKNFVIVASFTGFTLLFVLGMASTMVNQSNLNEETEQRENFIDGTIHMGATSTGIQDMNLGGIFELQEHISAKILEEFAVESQVFIADYDTNPLVSINLLIDRAEDTLEEGEIEDFVLWLMSDWETVNFHIVYAIMDGEMSIVGVEQWDDSYEIQGETTVSVGGVDTESGEH